MAATTPSKKVGQNIRLLRKESGLTVETLAQYLGTTREQLNYYELGTRAIPTSQLSKLANLFCIDEYDFYEEDPHKSKINIAFAFRANEIKPQDLESIAKFKKVVRNYLQMKSAVQK